MGAKFWIDFVTTLNDDEKTGVKPLYYINAKGDIFDARKVIETLRDAGEIEKARADAFLKFIPSASGPEVQDATHIVSLPIAQAQPLQKVLLGWGGTVQAALNHWAKQGSITANGESVDTSKWDQIQIDVSIADKRTDVAGRLASSLSFWDWWGGINLSHEEFQALTAAVSASEANKKALKEGAKIVGQGAGAITRAGTEAALTVLKEGGKALGIKTSDIDAAAKRLERIVRISVVTGLSLVAAAMFYALLRIVFRRQVNVNIENKR